MSSEIAEAIIERFPDVSSLTPFFIVLRIVSYSFDAGIALPTFALHRFPLLHPHIILFLGSH